MAARAAASRLRPACLSALGKQRPADQPPPTLAERRSASSHPAAKAWQRTTPLGQGRLQVWWTPLDEASTCAPDLTERYAACLPPADRASVASSASAAVAARRTAARALARLVLSRAADSEAVCGTAGGGGGAGPQADRGQAGGGSGGNGCTGASSVGDGHAVEEEAQALGARALRFRLSAHGKPHLLHRPGWPTLRHNLTHTADMAGVAVLHEPPRDPASSSAPSTSYDVPYGVSYSVGLDVERLDRAPKDPLAIARRRLAPGELAQLEALPDPEARRQRFVALWTLKEAYVKARGSGISAPPGLKGFEIGFADLSPAQRHELAAACGQSGSLAPAAQAITLRHVTPAPAPTSTATQDPASPLPSSAGTAAAGPTGTSGPLAEASAPARATVTSPAETAAGALGLTASAGGSVNGAVGAGLAGPGREGVRSCLVEMGPPEAASYGFLLFQPTPHHIAAVCVAARWCVVGAAEGPGAGRGGCEGEDGGEECGVAEVEPGLGLPPVPSLTAAVEQWWCVPLAAQRRLAGAEVTLLGLTP
ncbi:hypothetical protein HYH03_008186 [Edaphochlamys debaryana]|uniref:holo-[acyl-carrier-protein] synthase n=1 Tax=Edaphochlamys debaryana TaxID=47281 RepID=A0A835Y1V0_9CHLO|nr:hypothetical protein HYH03_008186 [Edaphochlamys debaryana]|eukprot:KAG2493672.1 hypothetical protein HYH03_008186 [Edaphochlamys debaryana]